MTQIGVNQLVNFGEITARRNGVVMIPSFLNEPAASCYVHKSPAVHRKILAADFEFLEFTTCLFSRHLHALDISGHPLGNTRQESVQLGDLSLTGNLHASIFQVPNKTRYIKGSSHTKRRDSKTDSLDSPLIKHLATFLMSILDHPANSPEKSPGNLETTFF